MPGPYYMADKAGVVRLQDQFANGDGTSPNTKTSGNEARGAGGLPGGNNVSGSVNSKTAPAVPPEVLDAAKHGDPNALKLLEMLAVGAGTAGAAYGAYRYLKNRKGKNDTTSSEVKDAEPAKSGRYMTPREPDVTPVTDEQIIPRTSGYLQPQNKLPAPTAANEVEDAAKARKLLKAQAVARALTHIVP